MLDASPPNQPALDELRGKAERLRELLEANPRGRPFFVEFSGTPKSGKSTCIDIVAHFFRRLNFKVLAPTEGASKRTPYFLKDDLVAFNTWSAAYALHWVLEGVYHSDKHDIAILDRGLFDALGWFELLAKQGKISAEERDRVHNFLLMDNWRAVIDLVFLFTADHSTSLTRENADKLLSEPGRAMNPELLQDLNEAYGLVREKYSEAFPAFFTVNTSGDAETTPKGTALTVARQIVDAMEAET